MRPFAIILGAMALVLGIGVGLVVFQPAEEERFREDVLAYVHDTAITVDDVEARIAESHPNEPNPEVLLEELLVPLGHRLVREELLASYARQQQITPDMNAQGVLIRLLEASNVLPVEQTLSPEQYHEVHRTTLLLEVKSRLGKLDAPPTEEQIAAYYDAHREQYLRSGYRSVRRVVVDERRLAARLRNQMKLGVDFEDIVRRHSITADAENGGLLPPISNANLDQVEYGPILMELEQGDLSHVVETPVGFQIFFVEEYVEDHVPPLEEVRSRVVTDLSAELSREKIEAWLHEQEERGSVEWNPAFRRHHDDPWTEPVGSRAAAANP